MKKRIASLLLILALCFTLLPTAALAEDGAWDGSIATAFAGGTGTKSDPYQIADGAQLAYLASEVNKGKSYENSYFVLTADIDLGNKEWTPIGIDSNAFAGTFHGNRHTISNLDFSSTYGNIAYESRGFFGYIKNAEISDLTVQGAVNVTKPKELTALGLIVGKSDNSTIRNCVSDISFTSSEIYLYGYIGLCGYALNSTIEYCQSKGDISITRNDNDPPSLCVGGIVGYAGGASEIRYCANTVNIEATANHVGGIAGSLGSGNPSVTNCYSTGKLIVRGRPYGGNTGGIVGTINGNVPIKHCYFAGGIDLNNYSVTTLPYSRLGGLVGKVESGTPVFENNYFIETENVTACSKYIDAGTAKSLESMKTVDFLNEITTAGGNYRFNPNGTPILPAPKYAVSFVVTPAELANVVIKVNGQEVANPVYLEAGTYKVEVSADNCAVFTSDITITADTATHTQTIAMNYLPADYTKVDEAIAKANALNKNDYRDFSAVTTAIDAVVRGKNITEQSEVNAMAQAIEDAINALIRKSSGGDDSDPTYAIEVGKDIRNGTVTANRRYAERGDTVTITVKPDNGFKLDELTVIDKNGNELKLTDKGDGKYTFTMPAGKVEINATFAKEVETSPFSDVSTSAYYYEAVKWAQEKGITGGIGNGLFGPNQPCTRAQIVTFLWRAAGSPEPKSMSNFSDVSTDSYYAKAVAWAVENGITTGTGDGKFSPDATCTRAQSVTFLFRAIGKLVDSKAEFSDVLTDSYYANAVAWAVENGVTNGIGNGLFGPDNSCTRAQIVTFLFRVYQGK